MSVYIHGAWPKARDSSMHSIRISSLEVLSLLATSSGYPHCSAHESPERRLARCRQEDHDTLRDREHVKTSSMLHAGSREFAATRHSIHQVASCVRQILHGLHSCQRVIRKTTFKIALIQNLLRNVAKFGMYRFYDTACATKKCAASSNEALGSFSAALNRSRPMG